VLSFLDVGGCPRGRVRVILAYAGNLLGRLPHRVACLPSHHPARELITRVRKWRYVKVLTLAAVGLLLRRAK
jgi:hypothetical protein